MVGFTKFLAWVALFAGILIGLLRVVAIRWVQVPLDDPELSSSLAPTLAAGDWIILWRLTRPGFGDLVQCLSWSISCSISWSGALRAKAVTTSRSEAPTCGSIDTR